MDRVLTLLVPEWCTHASVIDGRITSFVVCPSNDMLMTYEDATTDSIGQRIEAWTKTFLDRLQLEPTPSGQQRQLTGHFSFDLILSTKDQQLYPLECNARVHTAVILLPVSDIASCYSTTAINSPTEVVDPVDARKPDFILPAILRPTPGTIPRSWIYNDLIMRYLPKIISSRPALSLLHPSLPNCAGTSQADVPDKRSRTDHLLSPTRSHNNHSHSKLWQSTTTHESVRPSEEPWKLRLDPTLVAHDWVPFLVLWHVFWPWLLLSRWAQGKKWTRVRLSRCATGRVSELNLSAECQYRTDIRGLRQDITIWIARIDGFNRILG